MFWYGVSCFGVDKAAIFQCTDTGVYCAGLAYFVCWLMIDAPKGHCVGCVLKDRAIVRAFAADSVFEIHISACSKT